VMRPALSRKERMFLRILGVLGGTVHYTHSEIVVKRGEQDKGSTGRTAFGWHQDSGYIPYQHTPYLSCWCALSEMTTTNGTLSVLPIERNPPTDENHQVNWYAKPRPLATTQFPCYQHRKDGDSPDLVGYFGSDPGVEVLCPAGSIVVFSTLTLHCSSPNRSDTLRSAVNIQYAAVPLMNEDQQSLRHKADPFIIQFETNEHVRKWQE
jgi:ectoine hydroxylase-related dioxygenase (phytanoyl-CoA dioxygenase family)